MQTTKTTMTAHAPRGPSRLPLLISAALLLSACGGGSAPALPGPVIPGPVTPGPVTPGPVTPGPVTPGPVTPTPPKPANIIPKNTQLSGNIGARTNQPPTVQVTDTQGKPLAGATVTWQTQGGQGWVYARTATTDANGHASADWVLGDAAQQTLTASVSGLPEVTFAAQATALVTNANYVMLDFHTPEAQAYKISLQPLKSVPFTYFAAATVEDAYYGIQRNHDNTGGMLIFSVWDSGTMYGPTTGTGLAEVLSPGDATCVNFGNEGEGKSCRLNIQWALGERFEFDLSVKNTGEFSDMTLMVTRGNGQKLNLGTIRHSGVIRLNHATSFAEDYGPQSKSCLETGERLTRISPLQALIGGQWQTFKSANFRSWHPATRCANMVYGQQDGDFLLGTGGHLASDTNLGRLTLP